MKILSFILEKNVLLQSMKRIGIITALALIMTTLCLVSCTKKQNDVVISVDFDKEMWRRFDYLNATYNVKKAPMTADLVLFVTVSESFPDIYPYQDDGSLTMTMTIDSPDGSRRSREYKFRLKDSEGNFKSEMVDGYYNYELPLISEMSFREAGDYVFKIENKYSKDPLFGIKRLSIKCLQTKN
jgi:gliding motility-associated lipoprotein GldH